MIAAVYIGCADDRRRIIRVNSNDALRSSAHPMISEPYRVIICPRRISIIVGVKSHEGRYTVLLCASPLTDKSGGQKTCPLYMANK